MNVAQLAGGTLERTSTKAPEWIETKCILCGSNQSAVLKYPQSFSPEDLTPDIFSARRETEHYHYRFVECRKCGQVFSSPVLAPAAIAELYRGSKLTYAKETSAIAGTYLKYLRRNIQLLERKSSAFELGCGNGFFLRELARIGFEEVAGVEPSEDAVSKAGDLKEKIVCGFFEAAPLSPNSYDLICCFQTLDHVLNPLLVLERCYSLLRPGGILYVIVHNERALQARIFGEKSPVYDVEHVYLFNPSTLAAVAQKAGLVPVKVFGVWNTYPLEYWLRMAPLPAKSALIQISRKLHISKWPVTIPAGNLGLFARKEKTT